jgi:hypothetical protein
MRCQRAESTHVSQSRCPQCAAAVRPDAQWCSLCHARLGATPDHAAPEVAAALAAVDDAVIQTVAVESGAARARGRHAKGRSAGPAPTPFLVPESRTGPIDVDVLPLLLPDQEDPDGQLTMFGDVLDVNRIDLSALADRPVVRGVWSDLASRLDSTAAKATVILGGSLLVTAVVFGLMALLGTLFA